MMMPGGGCSVARYDAGKMDRILLRFRPIAPKPTTGGSSSGESSPENCSNGRGKRRYKNNNNSQKNSNKRGKTTSPPEVVTPPLLPETPEKSSKRWTPIWLNFNSGTAEKDDDIISTKGNRPCKIYYTPDRTVVVPPRVTCITLECLTYTMVDAEALGRTDRERVMNLESDTCPGFVSDRLSRVTWSNAAFDKMMDGDVRAWVAMKESMPGSAGAFSCRVRMQVEKKKERKRTMTWPCDVWRMDCGGFAWRLDVKSALSLALC